MGEWGGRPEMSSLRQYFHEMADRLDEAELAKAKATLDEAAQRDFRAFLAGVPEDDEPLTAEDEKALAEADRAAREGRQYSHQEVLREFGLDPTTHLE